MTDLRTLGGPGFAIALAALCLPAPSFAETVTVRFNAWLPLTHWVNVRAIGGWSEDVTKATGGRVKIQSTTSSLGAPARQYQLAQDGVADLVWGPHAWMPGQFPLTGILDLPFLGDKVEALSVAYWRVHEKHFAAAGEHKGVKVLSVHAQAPGHLVTSNKPVVQLADLRGLKIRITGAPTAAMMEKVGGVPITAPSPQLQELLSRGVVDGTLFSNEGVVSFKLTKLVKYEITLPGAWHNGSFFFVMNPAKWDKIAPADQRAIEALSGEAFAKRIGRLWDAEVDAGTEEMRKAGIEIRAADAAFVATVRDRTAPLTEAWLAAAKAKNVDGAAALKMLREEAAAYKP